MRDGYTTFELAANLQGETGSVSALDNTTAARAGSADVVSCDLQNGCRILAAHNLQSPLFTAAVHRSLPLSSCE